MTFKKKKLIKKIKNFTVNSGPQHPCGISLNKRPYSCTSFKPTKGWENSERAPQSAIERCEQMLEEALSKAERLESQSLFDREFVGKSSTVSVPETVKVFKVRVLEELEQKTTLVTDGVSGIGTNVVQGSQQESIQQALQSEELSFLSNATNSLAQQPDLTDLVVAVIDKSSQM